MAGQIWTTNSLGGFMYNDELSDTLRFDVQPLTKFRQFCDAKDAAEKGLHKGENYHWDVYSDVSTQGGTLTETNTMPETNFTVTQGTLTVTEYGNSVPYSGKLEDLSRHHVEEVIEKALKHDARKTFDIAAYNQFDATLLRVASSSATALALTTDGTATGTNSNNMVKAHVKIIIDTLKERNVPPYVADDYMCISHPTTLRPFKNEMETIHQYTDPGLAMIFNGEVGRYESTRFIEQNQIPKGGAADSTTFNPNTKTADAWNNALSSWAFYFGGDTVAEGMALPEEIRVKIPTDYGRSKGVAWFYEGGFGIVHNVTGGEQNRIIKWDSAS